MKDKKFLALSSLFFLMFFALISVSFLDNQSRGGILRAKNATLSPLKSFAVAFPQVGISGVENSSKPPTQIKVSVYLRDVNGEVMPNRSVKLSSPFTGLSINPKDTISTNDLGMAQFFVTSQNPGTAELTATDLGSNTTVANIPSIEFTQ